VSGGVDVDHGLDAFARSVQEAGRQLGDLHDADAAAAGQAVQAVEAPRLTGALDSTVAAAVDPDGFTLTAGGPAAPYAAIVHARNPFLTRAIDRSEAEIVQAYEQHIDTTLDRIQGA
jgi:hypothetical protein